jgi:hypothetical protein
VVVVHLAEVVAAVAIVLLGEGSAELGVEHAHLEAALGGGEEEEMQDEAQLGAEHGHAQLVGEEFESEHELAAYPTAP